MRQSRTSGSVGGRGGTSSPVYPTGFRRTQSIDHVLSGGGSLHKFEYAYECARPSLGEGEDHDLT